MRGIKYKNKKTGPVAGQEREHLDRKRTSGKGRGSRLVRLRREGGFKRASRRTSLPNEMDLGAAARRCIDAATAPMSPERQVRQREGEKP